jgi:hypothetical protein
MAGENIDQSIREPIIAILKKHGAERIAIFGSYARGEAKAGSDIDVLVRFDHPKSLFQLVRIEDELTTTLHRDIDLLTEKSVSPHLAGPIHHDEVVIFG